MLGLVALLAGIAAPRFFGRGGFDERLFREEVVVALRYARNVAVATGCPVQMASGGGGYALTQRSGCAIGLFDRAVGAPEAPLSPYTGAPPPGVTLTVDVDPFLFDPLGRAVTPAGLVTDVAVTVGGRTIDVAGETGFVDAP